jgi:hypothetical protein
MPDVLKGHPRVVVVRGEMMEDALTAPLLEAVRNGTEPESSARFPGLEVEVLRVTPKERAGEASGGGAP